MSSARMTFDLGKEIGKNVAMGIGPVRRWRLARPRTAPDFSGRDEDLERFALFGPRLLGEHGCKFRGLHVAEIGPGDMMVSGLAYLAAGAASYTAFERFPGRYRGAEARRWYDGLAAAWSRLMPETPWPSGLDASSFSDAQAGRFRLIDLPIEQVIPDRPYDLLCSFQVAEHVSDIRRFASTCAQLLAPGGAALHRVDFGPHDCWARYRDPLTFLRVPEWLWHLSGSNRGTPNRSRHHEFCEAFAATGLKTEAFVVERFTPNMIDIDQLSRRFKRMPLESVLVKTAIYVSRKS